MCAGGPLLRCNTGRARTVAVGPDRHALRVVECCLPAATVHEALDAPLTGLGIHCAGSPIDRLDNVVACVAHVDPAILIATRRPAGPVEAACHRAYVSANRSRVNCRLDRHLVVKAEATSEEQHEDQPLKPWLRHHTAAGKFGQPPNSPPKLESARSVGSGDGERRAYPAPTMGTTAPSSSLMMSPPKMQVCMVTVLQDEARWLPEWLEYHLALGVGHFFLYDDGSTDTLEASLGPYREAELVTLTNVSSLGPPPTHVLTRGWNDAGEPQQREVIFAPQYLAIRHATATHGHLCRWMAFFDVDEFVAVPSIAGGRAFATYLRRLEIRRPAAGGVRLFSVLMLPRNATDRKAPPPDALLLKSFIRRAIEGQRSAKDDPHHIRFKCAARPEALDPQVSHCSPPGSWTLAWQQWLVPMTAGIQVG